MVSSQVVRFPEDAPMYGKDVNRILDWQLGNNGAQRKWLGWDGAIVDPVLGTSVSTGNYADVVRTTHGAHTSVQHSAGTTDTPADQVFATNDGYVTIGRGGEARFYNTLGTNYANWKHSTTNDVLKTDDGVWVAGALNVGSAINATDAGDVWIGGGLSIGTYSNPGAGALVVTGNATLGDADTDAHTLVGLVTFRNAASTAVPLYVDAANNRAQFGSTTPLGSATNSKVEVIGGRLYVAAGSEQQAIGVRYGTGTGTYYIGATNQATTPSLIFKDHDGTEVVAFGDSGDALQCVVTGIGSISSKLVVGGNTFSGAEKLNVVGAVRVTGTPSGTPEANNLYATNICKAWALFQADGAINASFNVTSVAHTATGRFTVTLDRDFAAATYAVVANPLTNSAYYCHIATTSYAAGTFEINVRDAAGALQDPNNVMFVAYGTQ